MYRRPVPAICFFLRLLIFPAVCYIRHPGFKQGSRVLNRTFGFLGGLIILASRGISIFGFSEFHSERPKVYAFFNRKPMFYTP